MEYRRSVLGLASYGLTFVVTPLLAQTSSMMLPPRPVGVMTTSPHTEAQPVAPGHQHVKPAPRAGNLVVTNQRRAMLLELSLVARERGNATSVMAGEIPPGGRQVTQLPARAGCIFNVEGRFADGSTVAVANINLCKDGRINLVE
jgi:hypothetical protein